MKNFISVLFCLLLLTAFINLSYSQSKTIRQKAKEPVISCHSSKSLIDMTGYPKLPVNIITTQKNKANTTLLTENFSATTFPPTGWSSNVITGTLNWSRGIGAQTYATFSTIGTSAADGYAFVDSDGNGGSGGSEECVLTTPAINCTGYSYVYLKFNEYFRQYGSSTGNVEVSNNGSTWTVVHSAHTGLITNESTDNPWKQDIDISSIAANQATVFVRFHWTGNYDYYWFIDDIEIYAREAYDAALIARTNMNEYTLIPHNQYTTGPLTQNTTVWNAGGATITNVSMTNTIYDGSTWSVLQSNTSNTLASLTGNSTGTLTASNYTPPAGTGIYISENIVQITETDAETSNDTLTHGFWINDSIFARDDALFTGLLDGSLGSNSDEIILGNTYTFTSYEVLTHVRAYVTGPEIGNQAQIVVYNFAGGIPTTQLAASSSYTFTTAGGQWIDLPMSSGPYNLNPGTYFFGVRQISTTTNLGISYTDNNFTPLTSFVKIGTNDFDTLSDYGYDVSFIIHPIVFCASYQPIITPTYSHLCTGEQVTLISNTADSYLWSPGNQTSSSITVNQGGTYSVQTTYMGCTGNSDTLTLNEYSKPVIFIGNDTTVCDQIQLDAGGGFASYEWTGGGTSQTLDVNSTGSYSVTVSDAYCSNADTIDVTVNTSPTPSISGGGNFCDNAQAQLDAGSGYDSYVWSVGTSTDQYLNVDTALVGMGTTTIYVTVSLNNCEGTTQTDVTFYDCTDIEDMESANRFLVYPNPSHGSFTIHIPDKNSRIAIYNMLGENVYCKEFTDPTQNKNLYVTDFKPGVYLIKLYDENSFEILKLLIE